MYFERETRTYDNGATINTVFIDIRKMQSLYKDSKNMDREFLYRLLYVAVTRASKDINISTFAHKFH